ncbi:pilin [Natrinema hispanicum]
MNTNSPRKSSEASTEGLDLLAEVRQAYRRVAPAATSLAVWLAFITLASGSVAAQSNVGDVYCGTGVETGIGIVFGAVAGLGLPATGFYVGRAGLSYMRAGGNPEKKNQAKERLVMSGIGFGIIVLALISPELIDKVGSQMGFGFSDCVKPF